MSVPDVIAYSGLISVYKTSRQPERAVELFEILKQQELSPALSTYSALMQVLAAAGQIVAGFELLA